MDSAAKLNVKYYPDDEGKLLKTMIVLLQTRSNIFHEPLLYTSDRLIVFPDRDIQHALSSFNEILKTLPTRDHPERSDEFTYKHHTTSMDIKACIYNQSGLKFVYNMNQGTLTGLLFNDVSEFLDKHTSPMANNIIMNVNDFLAGKGQGGGRKKSGKRKSGKRKSGKRKSGKRKSGKRKASTK